MHRSRARRSLLAAMLAVAAGAAVGVAACTDTNVSPSSTGLTSPPTAPTTMMPVPTTASRSAVPPAPDGTKWKLLFDDEFSGTTLDPDNWATCYPWAGTVCTNTNSSEDELYTPRNVTVGSGELRLTARREQITDPTLGTFPFTSGMVSTKGASGTRFAFRYGFVQARMWIPRGTGLWSAFWLLDAQGGEEPEIDIAESRGQEPGLVNAFVHWLNPVQGRIIYGNEVSVPGAFDGWHIYAVDWEPDSVTFYVDGVRVWVMDYKPAVPTQPMFVIGNLAVGGDFAKTPSPSTKFPAALRFDWIKVWQHS